MPGGLDGAIASAFVKIEADTSGFQASVEQGVQRSGAGQSAAMATGKKLGTAVAAGAAGVLAKGVFDFTSFERGMNEVFTLIPDAGEAAYADLTAQTKSFAAEFGVLPDEVIPSLYDSLSAGVPADNVFAFLEEANEFAKAGAVDLSTSVDALTTGVNAFGLGAEGAGRVSDSLFTAVKLGKTTVDELSSSLFQVAPIAASFGVTVEDVSGAFATLTAQGTPTSVAATQLKGAISELGKEGTKASDIFLELSGKSFAQFTAEGGTLVDAAGIMAAGADELGISMVDMFGSVEAGQAFVGLSADLEKSAANLQAVQDGTGATEAAFARMEQGIGPALDKVKARLAVSLLNLGETLAPSVETAGKALAGFLSVISQLPGPLAALVVGGIGLAGALLAVAGPMLKVITLVGKMAQGIKALTAIMAANPWVLLALALAAVVFLVIKYWDEIVAAVEVALEAVTGALSAAWDWVQSATSTAWDAVTGAIATAWDAIVGAVTTALDAVVGAVTTAWDAVYGAIATTLGAIRDTVVAVWYAIVGAVTTVLDGLWLAFTTYWELYRTVIATALAAIQGAVQLAWDTITGIVSTAMAVVQGIVQVAWDTLQAATSIAWAAIQGVVDVASQGITNLIYNITHPVEFLGNVFDTLLGTAERVWNGLSSVIGGAVDTAIRAIDRLKSAIASLPSLPDITPGFNVPGIPGLAGGGTALAGRPHWVGEDGPELFYPARTGTVVPHSESMAAAGAGGGGAEVHAHLHVDASIDRAEFRAMLDDWSLEVARTLQRQQRQADAAAGRQPWT